MKKTPRMIRCSACHEYGHNKTNKSCRGYFVDVNSREDGLFEIAGNIGWGIFVTDPVDEAEDDEEDFDDNNN